VSPIHLLVLVTGLVLFVGILEILRRRQLREKYAILWLLVGGAAMVLAAVPRVLDRVAGVLHVADPPNLLLFGACVVLLLVTVQLSWESSRLEDETRALAEELALLRYQVEQLQHTEG
jgi:hypothetical protein